jgi:hypothetical protein
MKACGVIFHRRSSPIQSMKFGNLISISLEKDSIGESSHTVTNDAPNDAKPTTWFLEW